MTLYYWRVRTRLPERFGEKCYVLARGKMNNCLVEFLSDGYKVVTSRNFVRKISKRTIALLGAGDVDTERRMR